MDERAADFLAAIREAEKNKPGACEKREPTPATIRAGLLAKAERVRRGLSVAELARAMPGATAKRISWFERGEIALGGKTAAALAAFLGLSFDEGEAS